MKNVSDLFKENNNKLIRINEVSADIVKKLDLSLIVVSTICDIRDNKIELVNKIGDTIILILDDNFKSVKSIHTRNLHNNIEPIDITPLTGCFIIDDISYIISSYITRFKENKC